MRCFFVQLIVQLRGNLCRAARTCAAQPGLLLRSPIGRFPAFLENLFPRKKRFSGKSPGLERAFGRFGAFWKILFPFSSETAPQISVKREQISLKTSKTPDHGKSWRSQPSFQA